MAAVKVQIRSVTPSRKIVATHDKQYGAIFGMQQNKYERLLINKKKAVIYGILSNNTLEFFKDVIPVKQKLKMAKH